MDVCSLIQSINAQEKMLSLFSYSVNIQYDNLEFLTNYYIKLVANIIIDFIILES